MRKTFAILLCALFAATAAEARTLYVNANRPNNNGNGLKPSTAKKTLQAAINIAREGDTILVLPGSYSAIKTDNRKIAITSFKGASKTRIVFKPNKTNPVAIARLGATYTVEDSYGTSRSSDPRTKGKKTRLTGFLLDGRNLYNNGAPLYGVCGGTVRNCSIQRLGTNPRALMAYSAAAADATLKNCTILKNYTDIAYKSVLNRCRIAGNMSETSPSQAMVSGSRLCNCLLAGNAFLCAFDSDAFASSSVFVNCTLVKNAVFADAREDFKDGPHPAVRCKYYNCILRDNFLCDATWSLDRRDWWLDPGIDTVVCNVESSKNDYVRTYRDNRNPKFADEAGGDCRLKKGSPCINQGVLNMTLWKWLGTLDLAGKKRIHGKAIDMGCYEY